MTTTKSSNWFKNHIVISILLIIILLIVISLFVYGIIYYKDKKMITINGNSMYPTLKDGEIKYYDKNDKIERFDIIVFVDDNKNILTKRVYGLPNETISIDGKKVSINSKIIGDDIYGIGNMNDNYTITLDNDEVFVLGDNRDVSLDSRSFGPVKIAKIKGKIILQ